MKTPEGYEKDAVKKYLDKLGAWHFSPYMAGFGGAGVPDIIALYQGRMYALEVKREGKGPTVLQTRRIAEIRKAGGYAWAGTADVLIREIANTLHD